MEGRPRKHRVIKEYKSPYPIPNVFREGEQVEILKEFTDDPDWENWVWCKGKNGKQAWAPVQYLTIDGETGIFRRNYNAMELSVSAGEELSVYEEINGFGMAEKADGKKGWVPLRNMVEEKEIGWV
jgi:hypothetical protein